MIAEAQLAHAFMSAHPTRAAMSLEQMELLLAAAVLESTPPAAATVVVREMNASRAAACLEQMVAEDAGSNAAAILALMPTDESAMIVRSIDPERRTLLLGALSPDTREQIERALPYPEGTAGAVMDPGVFRLTDDVLVADARDRLRSAARELLYYVYIVDREQRLVGVLDIPELLLARSRDTVGAAMHRTVQSVTVTAPVALVREHAGWQSYHALPVVDENGVLLGAIRYQTLRRLERNSAGRETAPGAVTAGALAELFQLGTSGLVAGLSGAAAPMPRSVDRSPAPPPEPRHDD